jgi:hypothetical protein
MHTLCAFSSKKTDTSPCANVPALLVVVLLAACDRAGSVVIDAGPKAPPEPSLLSVGPRLISNQTSYPLEVRGSGLKSGMTLDVKGTKLPLFVLDEAHAWARLPAGLSLPLDQVQVQVAVSLSGSKKTLPLQVVNDTAFPVLSAMVLSSDAQTTYVASLTQDLVFAVDLGGGEVKRLPVGDGPSALGLWKGALLVAHRFAPELRVQQTDGTFRSIPAPANAASLLVEQDVVFIAEHARDSIVALDLGDDGKELWRTPVFPNPGPMAMTAHGLAVGSLQTGELMWLEPKTGKPLESVQPKPGTPILGAATKGGVDASMSPYVMNGQLTRGLAWSNKAQALLLASSGPNLGPNPKRVEVTMNGGVAVIDAPKEGGPVYRHHLGFGSGVTQAVAVDDAAGLVYAADLAEGLVRVLDLSKLTVRDAKQVEGALLQELAIPPPDGFPLVRAKEDFAVNGRSGVSVHSGPTALALSPDRKTLFVLDRFTGTVAKVDVTKAAKKGAKVVQQLSVTDMLGQAGRRRGELLYFTDFGRTAMSCDTCHPDGHTGGILFEKTTPMRIYRSTTVRSSLLTPPYFTPTAAHSLSLGGTVTFVLNRNRFANPTPSQQEIDDLVGYSAAVTTLPNPFAGEQGEPPEALTLPDGKTSHPRKGMALFEGKAGCIKCHPAPTYTMDQDGPTRGQYIDVGTPHLFPLREKMQDPFFKGFATPALSGAWDVFPMFTTGVAGLRAEADGSVVVDTRFPLRKAVTGFAPQHGRADLLTPEEIDDLLGFVQTL